MTEYEREKVRDLIKAMTEEEKEIAWEVLVQERNKDDKKDDDLISRKALKQAIDHDFYEHYTKYHDTDQRALIDMVMDDIDEMPVAFDKEKVIEELDKLTGEECTLHECGIRSERCKPCIAKKAIEIVEKGGIE